ncbi:MAG: Na/Pi cotransporter family protein, partial [Candidatus Hydrogenedentes bacterium]|nr:Na/Pi cotransporter family protein [Candidatus Hydrogenedentota bacterium]
QSSSVTTSLVVPLIGAGVLTVERVYPYMLGANIGTTVTALLGSLAAVATTGSITAVTVALSHLIFNICGACVFYPLRFIPISIAKAFGKRAADSKLFTVLYLLILFFLLPLMVLLLQKYVLAR